MIDEPSLKEIFLFKNLNEKETDMVRSIVQSQSYPPNEKIVEEGKVGQAMFIIFSGRVRVSREFDKEPFVLTELGPFDFFGEMSLIDDAPTSATVQTLTETKVLKIARSDFHTLVRSNAELSSKLWESFARILTKRIRKTADLVKLYYGMNKALSESSAW